MPQWASCFSTCDIEVMCLWFAFMLVIFSYVYLPKRWLDYNEAIDNTLPEYYNF